MESRLARLPLMVMGIAALLVGLIAGLERLGWALPALSPALLATHGPLMVSGFIGTLISLERAVALKFRWAYLAPLLSGLGAVAFFAGAPWSVAIATMAAGSAVLVIVLAAIFRLRPSLHAAIIFLGGLSWLLGNSALVAGVPPLRAWPMWAGFLVLLIAGERLELSGLQKLSRGSRVWFGGASAALFASACASLQGSLVPPFRPELRNAYELLQQGDYSDLGVRLAGVAILVLAWWLFRYDVARRTVRQTGLPRFLALGLLLGYVWLVVAGALLFVNGLLLAGPFYDAALHAIFLGFAFAMIFAHAPIIFPAVLKLPVTYRPSFYAHVGLLHASLAIRVGGDLAGIAALTKWGGLLNAAAILLFLVNTVRSVLIGIRAEG